MPVGEAVVLGWQNKRSTRARFTRISQNLLYVLRPTSIYTTPDGPPQGPLHTERMSADLEKNGPPNANEEITNADVANDNENIGNAPGNGPYRQKNGFASFAEIKKTKEKLTRVDAKDKENKKSTAPVSPPFVPGTPRTREEKPVEEYEEGDDEDEEDYEEGDDEDEEEYEEGDDKDEETEEGNEEETESEMNEDEEEQENVDEELAEEEDEEEYEEGDDENEETEEQPRVMVHLLLPALLYLRRPARCRPPQSFSSTPVRSLALRVPRGAGRRQVESHTPVRPAPPTRYPPA